MVMCSDKDFLIRGVFKTYAVRIALGNFSHAVRTAILKHDADPVAARLLGSGLISGALMSVLLNEEERYSMRLDYQGPARGMILDIPGKGGIRGFICNPHIMTETESIDTACGEKCVVSVTRSQEGKVLNSGQSESAFVMPEAALSYYLSVSDQVESEIRSALIFRPDPADPVSCACGALIQALPGCDLELFNSMREKLLSDEAGLLLSDETLLPEEKLEKLAALLSGIPAPALEVVRVPAPCFECKCSAQKLWETARIMLGDEEFAKLLEENPDPAIRCQFCSSEHRYSASGLNK